MSIHILDVFYKKHAATSPLNAKCRLLFSIICVTNSHFCPPHLKPHTADDLAGLAGLSTPVTRKWLAHLEALGYVYRPSKRAKNTFKPRLPA